MPNNKLLAVGVLFAFVCASSLLVSDEPVVRPKGTVIAADTPNESPSADEKADGEDVDHWMQVKSLSAGEVFASLMSSDFKQLETSARRMQVLNLLEKWRRDNDYVNESGYQGELNAFEFATKELIRTAKDKDTDGALNAYINMTRSCVRCHQLIRDVEKKS